jgi:hypothetical protein
MNMNTRRPKNLGTSIEVTASNRPIKIAYIIPFQETDINHLLLDAVFFESYTRWAGAYTLIIPSSSSAFLEGRYEAWLNFFDPDFVYSYLDLEESLIKKIQKLCSPIALLRHKIWNNPPDNIHWRSFVPDWSLDFNALSSLTTVQSLQAQYAGFSGEAEGEITIITQYADNPDSRLFADNFGSAFNIHMVLYAHPGLFRTLCLVPADLPDRIIVGNEKCSSIADIFDALVNRKAMPIAKFAMAHSEAIPRVNPWDWSHSLNLFIGTTLLDRVHFWNARHFTLSSATSLGSLILDTTFFDDPDLVDLFGRYLNKNNFLAFASEPARVTIRSYSHSEEELRVIQNKLRKHTHNQVILQKDSNEPAMPQIKELTESYYKGPSDKTTFKLTDDINKLTATEPHHLSFLSPQYKKFSSGQWIIELDIQRHNNLSRYSNTIDYWELPRRREIVQAFTENLGKVTVGHRLALLPATGHVTSFNLSGCCLQLYASPKIFRYFGIK